MGWTDERVELLKKLWMEGLSASQIAGILGEGVTRNAVIGKVHRLKLSGRAKPASDFPRRSWSTTARRQDATGDRRFAVPCVFCGGIVTARSERYILDVATVA